MKQFKTILYLLAVVLSGGLASCNSSNNNIDTITKQTIAPTFLVGETGNATFNCQNVSYVVNINYTQMTADIEISGLTNAAGANYPTMTLKNVRWTAQGVWKKISGIGITPVVSNGLPGVSFATFRMDIMDRYVSGGYVPGFYVEFETNEGVKYSGSISTYAYLGDANCTLMDENGFTNQIFENKKVLGLVQYDPVTKKTLLSLSDVRLASEYSPVVINVPGIPTEYKDGVIEGTMFDGEIKIDVAGVGKCIVHTISLKIDYTGYCLVSYRLKRGEKEDSPEYSVNYSANVTTTDSTTD